MYTQSVQIRVSQILLNSTDKSDSFREKIVVAAINSNLYWLMCRECIANDYDKRNKYNVHSRTGTCCRDQTNTGDYGLSYLEAGIDGRRYSMNKLNEGDFDWKIGFLYVNVDRAGPFPRISLIYPTDIFVNHDIRDQERGWTWSSGKHNTLDNTDLVRKTGVMPENGIRST